MYRIHLAFFVITERQKFSNYKHLYGNQSLTVTQTKILFFPWQTPVPSVPFLPHPLSPTLTLLTKMSLILFHFVSPPQTFFFGKLKCLIYRSWRATTSKALLLVK